MAQISWKSILDILPVLNNSPNIWCKMLLDIKINSYNKAIFCHSKQLINTVKMEIMNACTHSRILQ